MAATAPASGPKPRKRLEYQPLDTADILAGTSPSTLTVKAAADGNYGGVKPASEAYMRTLHHAIVNEYQERLANLGLSNELGEQSKITLLVHSQSSEIEVVSISDNLDVQKKEILRRVIAGCSGKMLCPREFYEDMGELVKLDFPLAVKP